MQKLTLAVVAIFLSATATAQDADFIKLRPAINNTEIDLATENGFRGVVYPGGQHISSLLSYNAWGSTGVLQIEATYWGRLTFRNKIDNNGWSEWKAIWHSENLNPNDYLKSLVNAWNKDVTGRNRFHFAAVDNNTGSTTYVQGYGNTPLVIVNGDDQQVVVVGKNGEMGVGVTDTKGYKLAVGGAMIAERVKVKSQQAWPDFVFMPEYKLPSLQELEVYINQHRHLPGIPGEKEVVENGHDLGEMNRKLLQKVEELTLYIIQQDKELKNVKTRLAALEK